MKVFERIVKDRLVNYLESNSLVFNSQHGFRKRRSCLTQLITHIDYILNCVQDKDEVDVIYLDSMKAFDKVDHEILIRKVKI